MLMPCTIKLINDVSQHHDWLCLRLLVAGLSNGLHAPDSPQGSAAAMPMNCRNSTEDLNEKAASQLPCI